MLRFAPRLVAVVSVAVFAVVAVWLLWADRGTVLGDRIMDSAVDLGRSIERITMIDVIDRSDIPLTLDQVGHAGLWAVGTIVAISALLAMGWHHHTTRAVVAVAATSLVFELAQPLVSTRRGFELSDAISNLAGVLIGSVLVSVAIGAVILGQAAITTVTLARR